MSRHPPQPAMRFMGLRFDLDEVFGEATIRGPDLRSSGMCPSASIFITTVTWLAARSNRYVFDATVDPY